MVNSKEVSSSADELVPQIEKDDNLHKIIDKVEYNSLKVEKVVNELVDQYCSQLDELIYKFRQCLNDKDNPVTDEELDEICLKLPTYLYFIGETQEKFGIKEDIAKSVKMEIYNEIHRRTPGTIADKQAASEAGTLEEDIVYKAFQRSYKRIKQKLEASYEVLSSIKKVMQRRMEEMSLARIDTGNFRR